MSVDWSHFTLNPREELTPDQREGLRRIAEGRRVRGVTLKALIRRDLARIEYYPHPDHPVWQLSRVELMDEGRRELERGLEP